MKAGNAFKAFKNQTAGDILFDIFNYLILILFTLSILYPLYFIIIASFSDRLQSTAEKCFSNRWVSTCFGISIDFENTKIWNAYGNTIFYTVVRPSSMFL